MKQSVVSELYQAIEAVLSGNYYVTPALAKHVIVQTLHTEEKRGVREPMMELTSRQREVLQLIGQGKRTKEIAELLRLSIKTVEFHKNCIMKELGIHITIGLAHFATEPGHASGS